jgi:rare lipoprotein A
MIKNLVILFICLPIAISLGSSNGKLNFSGGEKKAKVVKKKEIFTGVASYYHNKFNGRKTSSGEIFSNEGLTGAHNTLPLGTWVKITNLKNDSVVIVKINDRMAKWNKRLIDLSQAAARQLNYINAGLAKVRLEVLHPEKADQHPNEIQITR